MEVHNTAHMSQSQGVTIKDGKGFHVFGNNGQEPLQCTSSSMITHEARDHLQ